MKIFSRILFIIRLELFVLFVTGSTLISDVSSNSVTNGIHLPTVSCTLHGQLGQGYYMQTFIGEPQQSVNITNYLFLAITISSVSIWRACLF